MKCAQGRGRGRLGWTLALLALATAVSPKAVRAAQESSDAEAFLRGNRLYESGDFAGAVAAYEEVTHRGRSAPELEYNLANAYLKGGEVGRAVLHYRRALLHRPDYENALANLGYARSLTQDVKNAEGESEGLAWVARLRLGPGLSAALLWIAATGFLVLSAVRFLRGRLPGWGITGQWVLASGALLLGGALLFEWGQLEGRRDGVVLAPEAEVRAAPGPENTLSFRLHEGTEVEILREVPGWREIKVSAELQGWISEEAIEEIG